MVGAETKINIKDILNDLYKRLIKIPSMQAYVGVTEEDAEREGQINNAQLIAIHTNGSPARNIPPRPIIEPAIEAEDNKERISEELSIAAKAMIEGDASKAKKHLEFAGIEGMNAAKGWFDDPRNEWQKNADATVRSKMRKKFKNKSALKKSMSRYSEGEEGLNTILVDTGEMRNRISYFVREGLGE